MNCERCGENYHEDNLELCAHCGKWVCPSCAGMVKHPATLAEKWICDVCRPLWKKAAG